ncbi:MAG: hypothetical protein HY054_03240 [Proteobacteria bacterium]|nr:hypothetical protein [Pseudomonadota bacterium]
MACAAGVGIRFKADAIEAVYDTRTETLFAHPQYELRGRGPFRVRIIYDLPQLPGGAHVAGARGVVELTRRQDGSIAPAKPGLVRELTAGADADRMVWVRDAGVAAAVPHRAGDDETGLRGLAVDAGRERRTLGVGGAGKRRAEDGGDNDGSEIGHLNPPKTDRAAGGGAPK